MHYYITHKTKKMKDDIKAKREGLKALSKAAAMLVKEGAADSINDALVMLYKEQGHEEVHKFKKWLELGYVVRRGEKALLLWGQPRNGSNQEKQTEADQDEYKFFPLAYVFSNKQVERLYDKK